MAALNAKGEKKEFHIRGRERERVPEACMFFTPSLDSRIRSGD